MKKTVIWVLVGILAVVGGVSIFLRVQGRIAMRRAIDELRDGLKTAQVDVRDLEVVVSGKGTIQPNTRKALSAGVGGTVSQVLISEGDMVEAGDVLVVLDSGNARYLSQQASLDLALAEESLAAMTGPAGVQSKARLEVTEAEASLTSARKRIDGLTVKSSIGGEVWGLGVNVGDAVKTGQVVATVADTGFTVTARVKQEDVDSVKAGQSVVFVAGGSIAPGTGTITSVAREGVAGSKGVEFPVSISVAESKPGLRAGMSVTVIYETREGRSLSFPGTVAPQEKRDIRASVDGTVTMVLAGEGAVVLPEQELIRMENESLVVACEQAQAALDAAQYSLSSVENQVLQQRLKVEQATISAKDKEDSLRKLTLRAPIAGRVISVSVESGDIVTASATLATVASVSPLTVVIPVDELDINLVLPGQAANVEVDAFPGRAWKGEVRKIAEEGQVKDGVTKFGVTVGLESDEIRIGMTATATIGVASKSGVLSVPVEAIKWDQGQAYVNKVENGQPVQTRIKIGVQNDLYAEIASGLNEGDTVLIGQLPQNGMSFRMPNRIPGIRAR